MNDDRLEQLLTGYIEGDISESEIAELHHQVSTSGEARQRFQDATRLNVLLRETSVEHIELQSLCAAPAFPKKSNARIRLPLLAVAVPVAATILMAIGLWMLPSHSVQENALAICMDVTGNRELSVRRGSKHLHATPDFRLQVGDEVTCDSQTQAMLRLSDGSILSMEPGSQIVLVSDSPEIRLKQGETFFEITPRKTGTPPFKAMTGHSTVAVMGTVFSLITDGYTELKVYEGSVMLTRSSDNATVEVGSQQMATTTNLAVQQLELPSRNVISLEPTDDATLDRGERNADSNQLKVEGGRRVVYMRFELPIDAAIRTAKLRLTQDIDAGSGTLRFFLGSHGNWTEQDLTERNAPARVREVAKYQGVVRRGQIVEVDVSQAVISPQPITIIMTLDQSSENDIWFGARESDSPPRLILDCVNGQLEA